MSFLEGPLGNEIEPVTALEELGRYQRAHIELHAYNEKIGQTCCEFCEALERVGESSRAPEGSK